MSSTNTTMTELIRLIAEDTGIAKRDVAEIVDAAFLRIQKEMVSGKAVSVKNFGKFTVRHRDSRPCRNPATGETVMSKPSTKVSFTASTSLKAACLPSE